MANLERRPLKVVYKHERYRLCIELAHLQDNRGPRPKNIRRPCLVIQAKRNGRWENCFSRAIRDSLMSSFIFEAMGVKE